MDDDDDDSSSESTAPQQNTEKEDKAVNDLLKDSVILHPQTSSASSSSVAPEVSKFSLVYNDETYMDPAPISNSNNINLCNLMLPQSPNIIIRQECICNKLFYIDLTISKE